MLPLAGLAATLWLAEVSPTPGLSFPAIIEAGSPFSLRSKQWSTIAASPWVLRTITRGFQLQFAPGNWRWFWRGWKVRPLSCYKFVSSRRCCCLLKPLHVNNIHTLSAHLSCTQFFTGDMRMILKPNLAFVPKVVGLCSPIDLAAFAASPEGQCAYALRPFHAVRAYVDRTRYFRRRNLLFFSWSPQGQTCLQIQTSPANQIGVMRLMLTTGRASHNETFHSY